MIFSCMKSQVSIPDRRFSQLQLVGFRTGNHWWWEIQYRLNWEIVPNNDSSISNTGNVNSNTDNTCELYVK